MLENDKDAVIEWKNSIALNEQESNELRQDNIEHIIEESAIDNDFKHSQNIKDYITTSNFSCASKTSNRTRKRILPELTQSDIKESFIIQENTLYNGIVEKTGICKICNKLVQGDDTNMKRHISSKSHQDNAFHRKKNFVNFIRKASLRKRTRKCLNTSNLSETPNENETRIDPAS